MTAVSQEGGRARQRRRTRRAIVEAALALLQQGQHLSVAAAAEAAEVSRRTAYRYFPTQEQLLTEAALETLRPAIEGVLAAPDLATDVDARLDALVRVLWREAAAHEGLLRAMVRLTVDKASEAEGDRTPAALPRRGYRRVEWIELALAPARAQLGGERFDRLVSAVAVCIGIEALLVLHDICGLDLAASEEVSRWMAQTLLRSSLRG